MHPQAILDDLLACGIVPSVTPDGRGIALPAGQLTPAQRTAITANKAALIEFLLASEAIDQVPAPEPKLVGWLDVAQPWRLADQRYQTHFWRCATCQGAAKGHADRCVEGQQLHNEYDSMVIAAVNQSYR